MEAGRLCQEGSVRVLAWFTGAFSAGIFLSSYALTFSALPVAWLLPAAATSLALSLGRFALPGNLGRRLFLAGTGLSLALGWQFLYTSQIAAPLAALSGTEQAVTMTLWEYPSQAAYGVRCTVRIEGLPEKAVYYGGEDLLEHRPGETVTSVVRFQDAARLREEAVSTFTSRGVFLLASGKGEAVYGPGTASSLRWLPQLTAQAMRNRIRELLSADCAPFLCAILTGDRSGLSDQASADLSETGLSHLLAVSGMHCGFLLGLAALVVGRHLRRLALCTIPALVFYAFLTGGSPSVVRASVMLGLYLAAPLFGRSADGPTSLCTALFLLLLRNPYAAGSISLQLSFASMAGLLWLSPKLYRRLAGQGGRIRAALAAAFSASMGALVFTAPLTAAYFGILPLAAPLSSLLCLWAAGGIFASGLCVLGMSLISPAAAGIAAWIPEVLIRYVLTVAHLLGKLPFHAVYFANPYFQYALVYAYLLFAAAWLWKPEIRRRYTVCTVLAVLALILAHQQGKALYRNELDAVVLDVGQGQSVVLASQGHYALVDCGSSNSWMDPGTLAAQQLGSMGCRRLDAVILTHDDGDHINGLSALLARMEAEVLLIPPGAAGDGVLAVAERYGVPVRTVEEQRALVLGEAVLRIFPPVGSGAVNETGLSVLASAGDADFLLTGDMGGDTERLLVNRWQFPDIEALMAGHHGAKDAASDALLDALTPEIVCVSVGSNSYGHPAPETLERLDRRGCTVYRTDRDGDIHLAINGSS